MATVNVGIKINTAVSAVSTVNNATLFTAPANGYAIINAELQITNTVSQGEMRVGGQSVFAANTDSNNTLYTTTDSSNTTSAITSNWALNVQDGIKAVSLTGIVVGPGQSVTCHGSSFRLRISGVSFVNTQ